MILEQAFVARHIPVGEREHFAVEIAVVRDEESVWWVLRDVPVRGEARPRVLPTFFAYAATHLQVEFCLLKGLPKPAHLVHCTYALSGDTTAPVRWAFRRMPQAPDGTPLEGLIGRDMAVAEAESLSEALRLLEAPKRMHL